MAVEHITTFGSLKDRAPRRVVTALLALGQGAEVREGTQEALGPLLVEPQIISARRGVPELTLEAAPSKDHGRRAVVDLERLQWQYTPRSSGCAAARSLQLRLVNKDRPGRCPD